MSSDERNSKNALRRAAYAQRTSLKQSNLYGLRRLATIGTHPWHLPATPSCKYCGAIRFFREPPGFCCSSGQVSLPLTDVPGELSSLLFGSSQLSIHFRSNIRTYNNAFAFTSFGVTYDKDLCRNDKNVYTFKVQGMIYHFINDLIPVEGKGKNLQLYFFDTENEVYNRLAVSDKLHEEVILMLLKLLKDNPYSAFFRNLREYSNLNEYKIVLRANPGINQNTNNLPTVDQIAAIWKDTDEPNQSQPRDIQVYTNSGHSKKVEYYYGCYDPLQYTILFPRGEPGWHVGIKRKRPSTIMNTECCEDLHSTLPLCASSAAQLLYTESKVSEKMSRMVVPVVEITPVTRYWTAKIMVIQKANPRHSQAGPKTTYQRFLLIDRDGTKVQAVIYGPDISVMGDILQLQQTYYISNARVTAINPKYQIVPHMYQWTINKTTVIRRETKDALPRELGIPDFVRFEDFPPLMNSETAVDIIAIVVDKLQPRSINTKFGTSMLMELYIINEERKPLLLTLWNELVSSEGQMIVDALEKMPVIAATHITVSDYNGLSLAAKASSSIILNPSYPQTQSLKDWKSQNQAFLTEVFEDKLYLKRSTPLPIVPHDNYSSIADAITMNTDERLWIKARAKIVDYNQSFWYMGCDKCLARTSAQYDWSFSCHFCNSEAIAKPRTKFTVAFSDNSSQLDATIFGEAAEKIVGLTAMNLMDRVETGEAIDYDQINTELNDRWFIVQIKKRAFTAHPGMNQYNVLTLVDATTEHESHASSSVSSSAAAGPSTSTTDDIAKQST